MEAIETTEHEDLEQLDQGESAEGADEGEQEAAGDDAGAPQSQEEGAPPRATRRERQEARKRNLVSERNEANARADRLEAVVARLAESQGALQDNVGRVAAVVERAHTPAAEDPVAAIKAKMRRALSKVGSGDEDALAEYENLQVELAETVAERRANAAVTEARRTAPQPDDEAVAHVKNRYGWLRTNNRAANAVRETALHLAETGRRDMGDLQTRMAVLEEAAATVAAAWKLPAPGAARGTSPNRFASASGRGGAPGGDSTGGFAMSPSDWIMAKRAFPSITDKGKLESSYRKMVSEELSRKK